MENNKKKRSMNIQEYGKITSFTTIERATEKPDGVSDVRWRIELRRRRNAAYYAQFGGV